MKLHEALRGAFALLDGPQRARASISVAASLLMVTLEAFSLVLVYPLILSLVGGAAIKAMPIPVLGKVMEMLPGAERTWSVALLMLAAVGLKSTIYVAVARWQLGFAYHGAAHMAARLLERYMAAPLLWHMARNSAELQRNVNASVGSIFGNVILPALNGFGELMMIAAIVAVMFTVEPTVMFAAVGFLLFSGLLYHGIFSRIATAAGQRQERGNADVIRELVQALGAVKELKLLGRESHLTGVYRAKKLVQAGAAQTIATIALMPRVYLEVMVTLMLIAAVLWIAGTRDVETTLATTGLLVATTVRLLPSIARILWLLQQVKIGAASLASVQGDLGGLGMFESPVRTSDESRAKFCHTLEMQGIGFTYPGVPKPALDGVTLSIRRGECVGLVGASGAGKTTLVDVLLGLLPPQVGRVLRDGEDITDRPGAWHGVLGYVPQSIYLIDDSLRRNVAFGLPNSAIDESAVLRALDKAQLADFIAAMPQGIDTAVGERGVRLSGGQRQRIGIARALYADPQVLVMDEGTAALDNETEARLTRAIEVLRGDKTIILIAHRLSTVRNCDRIVFMQNGRIADEGTFDDVARRHPDFGRMVGIAELGGARKANAV